MSAFSLTCTFLVLFAGALLAVAYVGDRMAHRRRMDAMKKEADLRRSIDQRSVKE